MMIPVRLRADYIGSQLQTLAKQTKEAALLVV